MEGVPSHRVICRTISAPMAARQLHPNRPPAPLGAIRWSVGDSCPPEAPCACYVEDTTNYDCDPERNRTFGLLSNRNCLVFVSGLNGWLPFAALSGSPCPGSSPPASLRT